MQVSTDYVFAGDADASPYPEDAPAGPALGLRPDQAGRRAGGARRRCRTGYVVRTAWLYGAHGGNFVRDHGPAGGASGTPRRWSTTSAAQPTWSRDLAAGLVALGRTRRRDAAGGLPRHQRRRDDLVRPGPGGVRACSAPTPSGSGRPRRDAFPRPAPRPAYSVLATAAWIGRRA